MSPACLANGHIEHSSRAGGGADIESVKYVEDANDAPRGNRLRTPYTNTNTHSHGNRLRTPYTNTNTHSHGNRLTTLYNNANTHSEDISLTTLHQDTP